MYYEKKYRMKSVTRVYEINKGSTIPFGRNQF